MTRKAKQQQTSASSPAELRRRVERARQGGHFQQALELAKLLHRYEPTPANAELIQEIYLDRARELRGHGQTRDALAVLDAAARLDGPAPAWCERLAQETAHCGDVVRALVLAEGLDAEAAQRVRGHVADAAVQKQTAGRTALPPALQADFDRVLLAFHKAEAGDDEAAREALQAIGLRSPFLEWKLLLRGLQAYWQNDEARALENWQRLNPHRLPARLAAPFRYRIDAAFRAAQTPAAQAVLRKQIDQVQGSPLLARLRTLQASAADKDRLPQALRQAEALLPELRREAPELVPRLARCFYWAILDGGPDDMPRYSRVFGRPADDPNFHRLQALGYEKGGDLATAHHHWHRYEQEIAAHPERWPGDESAHARALVWQRMGANAAGVPPPRPGRRRGDEPRLDPPAEKCYEQSLKLAPDLLETHEALVRYHVQNQRDARAEKAARRLLKHFPGHVPTLELLSDLSRKQGDHAAALELAQQALHGHALDRRLRRKVSDAHLLLARSHVEAGQFDEARRQFRAALDLSSGPDGAIILAHWAAGEFKAGDEPRAEELRQQALARTTAPVGVAFLLLTEVQRLGLGRALKARFERELKEGLAEPTADGAVFLSRVLAGLHAGGVRYVGQKGHTQKLLAYVSRAHGLPFTGPQLEELCRNLLDLGAYPRVRRFANQGENEHPENPLFPYLAALAWVGSTRRGRPYEAVPLLERAKRLAQAQRPDEARDRLLADVEKLLRELNPFDLDLLGQLFGFGDEDDDGPDDDW